MKAMAAPEAAVVLQPMRSVKMLTMGEQKKIMPMAKEPTHARERERRKATVRVGHQMGARRRTTRDRLQLRRRSRQKGSPITLLTNSAAHK